jgi:hypothetical protein
VQELLGWTVETHPRLRKRFDRNLKPQVISASAEFFTHFWESVPAGGRFPKMGRAIAFAQALTDTEKSNVRIYTR